jgi:hypothetical protein
MSRFLGCLVVLMLSLSATVSAAPDYDVCALSKTLLPGTAGHATGILFEESPNGPIRFSVDGYVMPNVYILDAHIKGPATFQMGQRGKLELKSGYRAIRRSDLGPGAPPYALVEAEINGGKGVQGMNGMLITHLSILDPELPAQVAALSHDADKVAASLHSKIAPYFQQKPAGHDRRSIEMTYMAINDSIQVRFARVLSARSFVRVPGQRRPLMRFWSVPYLTVCYHIDRHGKQLDRTIAPPGNPVETAKRYNPGGSPW